MGWVAGLLLWGCAGVGNQTDSGAPVDSGTLDAGPIDAGPSDSGQGDAGADGGFDAGFDAGVDAGFCVGTPDGNFIHNAGFECGTAGAFLWNARGLFAVTDGGHLSAHAGEVIADAVGVGAINYAQDAVPGGAPRTVCATAWLSGTAPTAQLVLRTPTTEFNFSTPVATTGWLKIPPSTALKAQLGAGEKLTFLVQTKGASPGHTLRLDDVDVWHSLSGLCDEIR